MRAVLVALGLVVASCSSCAGGLSGTRYSSAVVEHEALSAVRLDVLCWGIPIGAGSGTAISPRHVLTARHVGVPEPCPDAASFVAVMNDGRRVPMVLDVVVKDPDVDAVRLVVLGPSEPFHTYAVPAERRARVGERVCIMAGDGDTHGVNFHYKCGHVSSTGPGSMVVDMHGVPGNSGSAFFDSEGRILGILVAGVWDPSHENWAIGPSYAAWQELIPEPEVSMSPE